MNRYLKKGFQDLRQFSEDVYNDHVKQLEQHEELKRAIREMDPENTIQITRALQIYSLLLSTASEGAEHRARYMDPHQSWPASFQDTFMASLTGHVFSFCYNPDRSSKATFMGESE